MPFVLIQNFFPFFRYGMFAEPIQYVNQTEQFLISYYDSGQKEHPFSSQKIGLEEGHFNYILRSYYYQENLQQLFSQLNQILEKSQNIKAWKLTKIINYPDLNKSDTLTIFWQPDAFLENLPNN